MDVSVLLEPSIDLKRLTEVLDGLGHEGRVHTTRGWGKKRQAELYEVAKGYLPIDLDFLVPPSMGNLVEVIHEGKNTLGAFSHFQKRFVKLEGDVAPIGGYNHQTLSGITGPGYFVVDLGTGEHEGELAIDYTRIPKNKPASWPAIKTNDGGLGSLVYGGMIDYLRRLSEHVSIGRAYKKGKAMDAWFTLVRKDVA
ncbi:MAG TPA: hypothetical protein VLT33_19105 [Labilithrix sp.]|nr:hypothetical protein [Labilithrix sp.]